MEIHVKKVITAEITWQSMSQAYSLWPAVLPVGSRQQSNKLKEQSTWNIHGKVRECQEKSEKDMAKTECAPKWNEYSLWFNLGIYLALLANWNAKMKIDILNECIVHVYKTFKEIFLVSFLGQVRVSLAALQDTLARFWTNELPAHGWCTAVVIFCG